MVENKINAVLFWSRVDKKGVDDCWNWLGKVHRRYGTFHRIKNGRHTMEGSHRIAYVLSFGEVIPGMFVLHHCNNYLCCNPSHLYPGTHQQNMEDMKAAGSQQGSRHYAHKITESDVREIRRRIAEGGVTKTALAVEYGVCRQNIERIVHRKSWRHV